MSEERIQEIKNNLESVNSRIESAALRCGRRASEISLMAVSKTRPAEEVLAAYEAGQRLFGENRIQEAEIKFSGMPSDLELHMIGHLQSNKAKTAAKCVDCVQSIDKYKTALELNKHAKIFDRVINILIEINTSGEAAKSGYDSYEDFRTELEDILKLDNLRLRGLMTIAPFTENESAIRKSFSSLKNSYKRLKEETGSLDYVNVLSMGMSSDYEFAIAEGSTLVRIGTAIFGSRNL